MKAAFLTYVCATLLVAVSLCTVGANAQEMDRAMLRPINTLKTAMEHTAAGIPRGVFSSNGVVIVEDFPAFLFDGPRAEDRWWTAFKARVAAEQLSELHAAFVGAQDFGRSGDRVFFGLRTEWSGRTKGHRFVEHGIWSFVLVPEHQHWHIKSYAWAVTDCSGCE